MTYRLPMSQSRAGNDWTAVVVAVAILILLGAVLVTATARWTAADVRGLVETLAPVLGVVTGAFVTYFFTRQANVAATNAAQTANDVAAREVESSHAARQSSEQKLTDQQQRARELHNALSTALSMVSPADAADMRRDPVIAAALNSYLTNCNDGR
jgi:ABC-type nickel/cobalt efflux system permease component RcnA